MAELGWPARVCIGPGIIHRAKHLKASKQTSFVKRSSNAAGAATWRQTLPAIGLGPEVSEEDRILVAELGSICAASDIAQRSRDDFEPGGAPTPRGDLEGARNGDAS